MKHLALDEKRKLLAKKVLKTFLKKMVLAASFALNFDLDSCFLVIATQKKSALLTAVGNQQTVNESWKANAAVRRSSALQLQRAKKRSKSDSIQLRKEVHKVNLVGTASKHTHSQ